MKFARILLIDFVCLKIFATDDGEKRGNNDGNDESCKVKCIFVSSPSLSSYYIITTPLWTLNLLLLLTWCCKTNYNHLMLHCSKE